MGGEKCVEAEQAAGCNPGAASISQDESSQSISRAAAPLQVTSSQQMGRRELHRVRHPELKTQVGVLNVISQSQDPTDVQYCQMCEWKLVLVHHLI